MKALVYTGTQMSEIRDVDVPVVGDNKVLVDLAFCGICGSDMHAWHCLLYTSPSPRDATLSRMPSSA